ncbi:hypothetical protein NHX12_033494 [Muraenolepis orangiensis]|uniref:Rho-GAP domain-containing protein n=1 Tax=Muraenolepis orangiensis TaxID=630683 RepID=A0A9Q0E2R0_9TELE|nr:hypothetical protein NHX12_033494 [Muraenolepis orangiensis]
MADPLRRNILAKLRGKKSKKGALSAAEDHREGKEPVFPQQPNRESDPVVLLPGPDPPLPGTPDGTSDPPPGGTRMSTYENIDHGAVVEVRVREANRAVLASACPRSEVPGGWEGEQPGPGGRAPGVGVRSVLGVRSTGRQGDPSPRGTTASGIRSGLGTITTGPSPVLGSDAEESIVIRNLESYGGSELINLQSLNYFPAEADINMAPTPPEGSPARRSLDSEEDDYYDNQILPFYEAGDPGDPGCRQHSPEVQSGGDGSQGGGDIGIRETERLRSQLKEAYHLLINAMLSLKNLDSDSWSSGGEPSPRRGWDSDPAPLRAGGRRGSRRRASDPLDRRSWVNPLGPVPRRASDGAIGYGPCSGVSEDASGSQSPEGCEDLVELGRPEEEKGVRGEADREQPLEDEAGVRPGGGSSASLPGSSDNDNNRDADAPEDPTEAQTPASAAWASARRGHHGVTVNKMQEWMHKGRLLMKPQSPGQGGGPEAPTAPRPSTAVSIENVQGREPNQRANSITVSKKRNWLQQSSLGRLPSASGLEDEPHGGLGAEEEAGQTPHPQPAVPPGSSVDLLRPHLPQVSVSRADPLTRGVDPAEENDADDEGEIWYNPIPEEEDPHQGAKHNKQAPPPPGSQAPKRRPSRDGGPRRAPDTSNDPGRPQGLWEGEGVAGVAGGGGDGSQGNAAHSTEAPHLHRQMLACRPQEEAGPPASRATDGSDGPHPAGFSPPPSPNPAKKPGSLNWSFPDKIKSPRTVRNISMKMKKLPELSRKLSVKGPPSSVSSIQWEPRAHSFRPNGSGPEATANSSGRPGPTASGGGGQAGRNVISRYHLDSSVSPQHSYSKKKNAGGSKAADKGGYLSDGDSPEPVAKAGKHGPAEAKGGGGKEWAPGSTGTERAPAMGGGPPHKLHGPELDIDAFRHYSFSEQPKSGQYVSGPMSLHFYGAEDLKPPRPDSRDVYCAIQVDSVNKARTALLTCRTGFLDMDHTFNIELENAQQLKLLVFSWEAAPKQRNRLCCHGTVALPPLFRVTRSHQLAVRLEPRGLIYVKLSLMEHRQNSPDGDGGRERRVFGVEAWRLVEREGGCQRVPLLIHKCITEIEKRGCQVVGLYRLCGSAAVKKELREAFERDSHATELSDDTYPDINVITGDQQHYSLPGVLKDYLRELPFPLITKQLYEAVLEAMAQRPLRIGASGCENHAGDTQHTVSLLEKLPEVERVTLRKLLDHLKLVASHQEVNKMTCQNLAVCFGPVLLSQRQEASCHSNRVFMDSEELASALHFKKHIEVLHYLLQLWPVISPGQTLSSAPPAPHSSPGPTASSTLTAAPPLRRRKERPQVLNLSEAEMAGVLRPRPGRLDSPSNRYAGDWSRCGESYSGGPEVPGLPGPPGGPEVPGLPGPPGAGEEAHYDRVPSEEKEAGGEEKVEVVKEGEEEEVQEKLEGREQEREEGSDKESEEEKEVVLEEEKDNEKEEERDEVRKEEEEENEEEWGQEREESSQLPENKMEEEVYTMELEKEEEEQGEEEEEDRGVEGEEEEERLDHILPPHLPEEHGYQAYMKIQDISPVLGNRVNLRDLQESIDTLIGNLERELNKNKLNMSY